MSDVTPKSFLALLQKSRLCDPAELKSAVSQLFDKAGGRRVSLDQLTQHLLDSDLISEWHVKKLIAGKYKGYFLGKYKLIRHLGTGGMSTVYLAQHTIFNQLRAIKVLPRNRVADKSYLDRFYREGRAAAALNHRNIVRVYDIGNEGDTHYLVMEFVEGEDIYETVKRDGPLPLASAIDYTIQALTGLHHAHENDLVHRDIKPANLLVTPDGNVKILDLGLALFQEEDASLTVMHNEKVLGTADYLSPEQAVDSHNVDARSDIYSTGCTLYYMLTGKPPFHEGTIAQRIAMHQSRDPRPVRELRPDCPGELQGILEKMMRKKPEDRYQSCPELATELRHVADDLLINPAVTSQGKTQTVDGPSGRPPAQPSVGKSGAESAKTAITPATGKKPATERKPVVTTQSESASRRQKPATSSTAPKRNPATKPAVKSVSVADDATKESKSKQTKRRDPVQVSDDVARKKARSRKSANAQTAPQAGLPAQPGAKPGSESSATESPLPTKRRARKRLDGKAVVDATEVSVVISDEPATAPIVDARELQSFVSQETIRKSASVKPNRGSARDQLLMWGLAIAMLILLGFALVLALKFAG